MQNAPGCSGAFVTLELVPNAAALKEGSGFKGKQATDQNACLRACAMAIWTQLSSRFDTGIGVLDDAPGKAGLDERVSPVAGRDVSIGKSCRVVPVL